MRLKVISVNFEKDKKWIFHLVDSDGKDYYIMDSHFYTSHGLSSPIEKYEIDQYDLKKRYITVLLFKCTKTKPDSADLKSVPLLQ